MDALVRVERSLSHRSELFLLTAVIALAGILRMGWPGLTEFKADEAHLAALALDMVEGKGFPLRGITSSAGFPNFPMSVWLYAMPLFLWKHVYAATLFTGLLNTLAVLGCYWFVRRYWGQQAALAAALMFAVSPWAIQHSRKIWAQDLLPFFVMGWAISGTLAFVERQPKQIVFHLLCLAIAVQVHLAGASLIPATLALLIIFRQRVDWRFALLGAGLALLTTLPFIYDLQREALPIASFFDQGADTTERWDAAAFRYAWLLSSGREIHALAGPEAFADYLATVPDLAPVHWFWGVLILGGASLLVLSLTRKRLGHDPARELAIILLLWVASPLLLFSWPRLPVVLHYLLPIFPVPYIAAGVLASRLAGRLRVPWNRLIWALLVFSAVAQTWIWGGLLVFSSRRATPGGVGTPVAMHLEASKQAEALLRQVGADEVLVAGAGESPEIDEFPAIFSVLLRSAPHRYVDVARSTVFPEAATIVLLDPAAGPGARFYQEAMVHTRQVGLRPGEGELSIGVVAGANLPEPEFTFETPQILSNWAAIGGYDRPALHDDGTAGWRLYWYSGGASTADFHMFNHLLDRNRQLVGQIDAAVFSPSQWHERDLVISHFRLPWPREEDRPLTMRSGMYGYPV